MSNYGKIGERDLDFIVLYILDRHPNINTSELKKYIWYYTEPDGVNLVPLVDRNDTAIDQIVRNIISHRNDSSNNIINRGQLIASGRTVEQICDEIGADSLGYLETDKLSEMICNQTGFCDACFTGNYPIEPPTIDIRGEMG